MNNKILYASMNAFDKYAAPHLNMIPIFFHSAWKFTVLTPQSKDHFSIEGVDHRIVNGSNKITRYINMLIRLAVLVIKEDCPIILSGSAICLPALLLLPFINKKRLIYQTQDFLEPRVHPFWCVIEKMVARSSAYVFVNEENRARFMGSFYKLRRSPIVVRTTLPSQYVKEGEITRTDKEKMFKMYGIPENARIVLHPGPYSPKRCSRYLVEALQFLPDDYCLLFTNISTKSVHKEIQEAIPHISESSLNAVFGLIGLDFDSLLMLMRISDVGILLYPDDGIGNYYQCPGRLSEYICSGLPYVASNFIGLELLTMKYGLGLVCTPTNPSSISESILAVSKYSAKQREAIKHVAATDLSYETQSDKIRVVIENIQNVKL